MKKVIMFILASIIFLPWAMAGQQVVNVNNAYIPSGFDSASDAFVVVSGVFPSGCYQLKNTKVDHIGSALHEVRVIANVFEGSCIMVMVPFQSEAQLGKLSTGEHKINFMSGDGTYFERKLTIEN